MKKLLSLSLIAISSASFAGTYYYDDSLSSLSPTYHPSIASTVGTGVQYYSVFQFTVNVTGGYTIESASPNTSSTAASNALDTLLAIYENSFTPATPGTGIASNDDFTGAFTVLPGPYAGTVGLNGTGFSGALPSSRIATVNLTAGNQYYLVNSSFRSTDFVSVGSSAQATGHFYTGISGQGTITPTSSVPEPASLAVLGLGGLLLLRRRKRA